MAEGQRSFPDNHDSSAIAKKSLKRRQSMFDTLGGLAKWLLPSWAGDRNLEDEELSVARGRYGDELSSTHSPSEVFGHFSNVQQARCISNGGDQRQDAKRARLDELPHAAHPTEPTCGHPSSDVLREPSSTVGAKASHGGLLTSKGRNSTMGSVPLINEDDLEDGSDSSTSASSSVAGNAAAAPYHSSTPSVNSRSLYSAAEARATTGRTSSLADHVRCMQVSKLNRTKAAYLPVLRNSSLSLEAGRQSPNSATQFFTDIVTASSSETTSRSLCPSSMPDEVRPSRDYGRQAKDESKPQTRDIGVGVGPSSLASETRLSGIHYNSMSSQSTRVGSLNSNRNSLSFLGYSGSYSVLSSSLPKPERNLNKSIFYEGRTTFGGTAAHRKLNLFSPSPYCMSPSQVRRSSASGMQIRSSDGPAQQLIRTLERMNTPVQNAKRMPICGSVCSSAASSRPGSAASNYSTESRRREALGLITLRRQSTQQPSKTTRNGVPLKVGVSITSSRLPPGNAEDTIDVDAVDDSPQSNSPTITSSTSLGGARVSTSVADCRPLIEKATVNRKIKSVGSQSVRKGPTFLEDEPPAPIPDLPCEPLPLSPSKELPKFSFVSRVAFSGSTSQNTVVQPASIRSPLTSLADFSNKPFEKQPFSTSHESQQIFDFAEPVKLGEPSTKSSRLASKEVFSFGDPIILSKDSANATKNISSAFTIIAPIITISSGRLSPKSKDKCKIFPTSDTVNTTQTCDIAPKTAIQTEFKQVPKTTALGAWGTAFERSPGAWDCPTCLVTNKRDQKMCVACETKKPESVAPYSLNVAFKDSSLSKNLADDRLQTSTGEWSCSVCLLSNKSSLAKCVACDALKPSSHGAATNLTNCDIKTNSQLNSNLNDCSRKPPDHWNCESCFITNKNESAECIACNASRPVNATKTAKCHVDLADGETTLKSSASCGMLFKIPLGWECNTCLVRNKPEDVICCACKTSKVDSVPEQASVMATSSPLTFKFGSPSAVPSSTTDSKCSNVSPNSFKTLFGDVKTATSTTFKFGIPSTVSSTSQVENNSAVSRLATCMSKETVSSANSTVSDAAFSPTLSTTNSLRGITAFKASSAINVDSVESPVLKEAIPKPSQLDVFKSSTQDQNAKSSAASSSFCPVNSNVNASVTLLPAVGVSSTSSDGTPVAKKTTDTFSFGFTPKVANISTSTTFSFGSSSQVSSSQSASGCIDALRGSGFSFSPVSPCLASEAKPSGIPVCAASSTVLSGLSCDPVGTQPVPVINGVPSSVGNIDSAASSSVAVTTPPGFSFSTPPTATPSPFASSVVAATSPISTSTSTTILGSNTTTQAFSGSGSAFAFGSPALSKPSAAGFNFGSVAATGPGNPASFNFGQQQVSPSACSTRSDGSIVGLTQSDGVVVSSGSASGPFAGSSIFQFGARPNPSSSATSVGITGAAATPFVFGPQPSVVQSSAVSPTLLTSRGSSVDNNSTVGSLFTFGTNSPNAIGTNGSNSLPVTNNAFVFSSSTSDVLKFGAASAPASNSAVIQPEAGSAIQFGAGLSAVPNPQSFQFGSPMRTNPFSAPAQENPFNSTIAGRKMKRAVRRKQGPR